MTRGYSPVLSDGKGRRLDRTAAGPDSRVTTLRRPTMSESLKDKRILLVDDDHDILTSMQAAFEPTGAVIEMAGNGNKAVEIAERSQPDLVVLDMMLPGRSGF